MIWIARRLALGAAALWVTGCGADPEPARLHVVNLVENAPELQVRVCREDGAECEALGVPRDDTSEWLERAPGRYRFEVEVAARPLTSFSYGLGRGGVYALALYGIAEPPEHIGPLGKARRLLGGSEEPYVAGYQVVARVVDMSVTRGDRSAYVRLFNAAPGSVPLHAVLDAALERHDLAPVEYGFIGRAARVQQREARLGLAYESSPVALAQRELRLPAGSATVVYVGGFDGSSPRLVVDTWDGAAHEEKH